MVDSTMRLNSELIETDRLKTEFIEAASHELRGPVTAVNTAIQVMDNNLAGELSAQGRELVSIARTGSRRLVDLVNNLLDLTRIEAGGIAIEREEVNVGEIVNDTVKIFTPLAGEKGLRIDVDIKGADLEARLDAEALKRVLENLVSNAIKYTDEGSISVGVDATGEALEFTVRDTGRGIPARFQEDVFKKFSRLHLSTDSDERGAGLGLAISKGLVESHGGRIWVESLQGRGSAFHVELPRD